MFLTHSGFGSSPNGSTKKENTMIKDVTTYVVLRETSMPEEYEYIKSVPLRQDVHGAILNWYASNGGLRNFLVVFIHKGVPVGGEVLDVIDPTPEPYVQSLKIHRADGSE